MTQHNPAFRQLWDLGYQRLVPIIPPDAKLSPGSSLHKRLQAGKDARGKSVGVRGAGGEWFGWNWLQHPVSTLADIIRGIPEAVKVYEKMLAALKDGITDEEWQAALAERDAALDSLIAKTGA
jgi:hypothetical protein